MFVYTGESYRNLEAAIEIRPVVSDRRCSVFVKFPDLERPICVNGQQASGVLEYVLKRLVGNSSEVIEDMLARENGTESSDNGKTRKKRVLRDPEASRRRMSEAALRRWAKVRREREALASPA